MKKEEFRELLTFKVEDLSSVHSIELELYDNPEEMYQLIQTMWSEYHDIFPNKGTYKQIRRMLIRGMAEYYDVNPELWCSLPAELCKEILYKADQHWISFDNKLQAGFRQYLIWKASQAGYSNRNPMHLFYVDENLKVVFDKEKAVGLAHVFSKYDGNKVEILFLRPLTVGNISRTNAKNHIQKWGSRYATYKTYLPTYATCCVVNSFLSSLNSNSEPVVHSCHVGRIKTSYSGSSSPCLLDDKAEVKLAKQVNKCRYAPTEEVEYTVQYAKKVYVSVYMSAERFIELNPRAHFPNYILPLLRD